MELLDLKVNRRTTRGNSPARELRRQQKIPAVLYGPKTEPIPLAVNTVQLEKTIKMSKGGQVFLNLLVQNGKSSARQAMIKELQVHPVTGAMLHVDFYEIDMDRKIKVQVPVITFGTSKGVELGGILHVIRRELEVSCLPSQIPDAIKVDITDLDVGDSVHVNEIPLDGDIEISADVNFTVVTISSPKVEAALTEEEAEAEALEEGEAPAETEGEEQ